MNRRTIHAPLLVLFTLYLASCSSDSGPQRIAVRGAVRLGNVPLANGQIRFIPTENTKGPAAAASIVDGEYAFTAADGPLVGTHRIEIESADRFDFPIDDEQAFAQFAQSGKNRDRKRPLNPVPDIYNTKSTLTRTVDADSEPVFDFELQPATAVTRR
jgi:hypothetical protein